MADLMKDQFLPIKSSSINVQHYFFFSLTFLEDIEKLRNAGVRRTMSNAPCIRIDENEGKVNYFTLQGGTSKSSIKSKSKYPGNASAKTVPGTLIPLFFATQTPTILPSEKRQSQSEAKSMAIYIAKIGFGSQQGGSI